MNPIVDGKEVNPVPDKRVVREDVPIPVVIILMMVLIVGLTAFLFNPNPSGNEVVTGEDRHTIHSYTLDARQVTISYTQPTGVKVYPPLRAEVRIALAAGPTTKHLKEQSNKARELLEQAGVADVQIDIEGKQ